MAQQQAFLGGLEQVGTPTFYTWLNGRFYEIPAELANYSPQRAFDLATSNLPNYQLNSVARGFAQLLALHPEMASYLRGPEVSYVASPMPAIPAEFRGVDYTPPSAPLPEELSGVAKWLQGTVDSLADPLHAPVISRRSAGSYQDDPLGLTEWVLDVRGNAAKSVLSRLPGRNLTFLLDSAVVKAINLRNEVNNFPGGFDAWMAAKRAEFVAGPYPGAAPEALAEISGETAEEIAAKREVTFGEGTQFSGLTPDVIERNGAKAEVLLALIASEFPDANIHYSDRGIGQTFYDLTQATNVISSPVQYLARNAPALFRYAIGSKTAFATPGEVWNTVVNANGYSGGEMLADGLGWKPGSPEYNVAAGVGNLLESWFFDPTVIAGKFGAGLKLAREVPLVEGMKLPRQFLTRQAFRDFGRSPAEWVTTDVAQSRIARVGRIIESDPLNAADKLRKSFVNLPADLAQRWTMVGTAEERTAILLDALEGNALRPSHVVDWLADKHNAEVTLARLQEAGVNPLDPAYVEALSTQRLATARLAGGAGGPSATLLHGFPRPSFLRAVQNQVAIDLSEGVLSRAAAHVLEAAAELHFPGTRPRISALFADLPDRNVRNPFGPLARPGDLERGASNLDAMLRDLGATTEQRQNAVSTLTAADNAQDWQHVWNDLVPEILRGVKQRQRFRSGDVDPFIQFFSSRGRSEFGIVATTVNDIDGVAKASYEATFRRNITGADGTITTAPIPGKLIELAPQMILPDHALALEFTGFFRRLISTHPRFARFWRGDRERMTRGVQGWQDAVTGVWKDGILLGRGPAVLLRTQFEQMARLPAFGYASALSHPGDWIRAMLNTSWDKILIRELKAGGLVTAERAVAEQERLLGLIARQMERTSGRPRKDIFTWHGPSAPGEAVSWSQDNLDFLREWHGNLTRHFHDPGTHQLADGTIEEWLAWASASDEGRAYVANMGSLISKDMIVPEAGGVLQPAVGERLPWQQTRAEFEATGEEFMHGTSRLFERFGEGTIRNRYGGEAATNRFYFTDKEQVAERFANASGYKQVEPHHYAGDEWGLAAVEDAEAALPEMYAALDRQIAKGKVLAYVDDEGNLVKATRASDIRPDIYFDGDVRLYSADRWPRVVKTRIYGRTLDLRDAAAVPDDLKVLLGDVKPWEMKNNWVWHEHQREGQIVAEYAAEHGYGKVRVWDAFNESGGESVIGLKDFIGLGTDPHRAFVERALAEDKAVPDVVLQEYGLPLRPLDRLRYFAERNAKEQADFINSNPLLANAVRDGYVVAEDVQEAFAAVRDQVEWARDVLRDARENTLRGEAQLAAEDYAQAHAILDDVRRQLREEGLTPRQARALAPEVTGPRTERRLDRFLGEAPQKPRKPLRYDIGTQEFENWLRRRIDAGEITPPANVPGFGWEPTGGDQLRKGFRNRAYRYILSGPDAYLSRGPLFVQVAEEEYQRLRALGIAEREARRQAAFYGADQARGMLYDLAGRTSAQYFFRHAAPFFPAWQEILTTWAFKIPQRWGPVLGQAYLLTRGRQLVEGLKAAGIDPEDAQQVPFLGWMLAGAFGGPDLIPTFKPSDLNMLTQAGLPGLGPLHGLAASALGRSLGGFTETVTNFLMPFGLDVQFGPASINRAYAGIATLAGFDPIPPWEFASGDVNQLYYGFSLADATRATFAEFAEKGINPPDPAMFPTAEDFRSANDEYIARLVREARKRAGAIYMIRGALSAIFPAPIRITDEVKQDLADFYNRIHEVAARSPEAAALYDQFLDEHPFADLYLTPTSIKNRNFAGDENDTAFQQIIDNQRELLSPRDQIILGEGLISRRLYEKQYRAALNELGSPPDILTSWLDRSKALVTKLTDWDRYVDFNDEFKPLWNKLLAHGDFPDETYKIKLLNDLSLSAKALADDRFAVDGIPQADLRKIASDAGKVLADLYDTDPKDPTDQAIKWWFEQVADPFFSRLDALSEQVDKAPTGEEAGIALDKIRDLFNAESAVTGPDGLVYPTVQEFLWGNKDRDQQLALTLKWTLRRPEWLTDFQLGQVGMPVTPQVSAFYDEVNKATRSFREYLDRNHISTSSTAGEFAKQALNGFLAGKARELGVTRYWELSQKLPWERLRQLDPVVLDPESGEEIHVASYAGMQQVFEAAKQVADVVRSQGYKPGGGSKIDEDLREVLYQWIDSRRDADPTLEFIWLDLQAALGPKDRPWRSHDAYDATLFGAFFGRGS